MNDGFYPLPLHHQKSQCRSCKAPIVWVQTASGARMPLDLGTVEHRDGMDMAQTHFALCPQGKAWSKRPTYHGPTGDPTDPESAALVTRYQDIRRKAYEDA